MHECDRCAHARLQCTADIDAAGRASGAAGGNMLRHMAAVASRQRLPAGAATVKIWQTARNGVNGKIGVVAAVLSTRRYAAVAAAGAAGTGIAYYFLTMSMLASHLGAAAGLAPAHLAASLGLTAAVSALAGINFALIAYRIGAARAGRRSGRSSSATTALGGAAAAFTPGCPACTAPLAVMLGAVGGLSVLPMQGLELKVLSAGVLLFSVYWVARGIERGSRSCCSAAPPAAAPAGTAEEAQGGAASGASREAGGRGGGCSCGRLDAGAEKPEAAPARAG